MTAYHDAPAAPDDASSPAAHQAFLLLRTVFTVATILFGLDKFVGLLTLARLAPAVGLRRRPVQAS